MKKKLNAILWIGCLVWKEFAMKRNEDSEKWIFLIILQFKVSHMVKISVFRYCVSFLDIVKVGLSVFIKLYNGHNIIDPVLKCINKNSTVYYPKI